VPFCTGKCYYCDFYSIPGTEEIIDNYMQALREEARIVREQLFGGEKPALDTIFLGGGTPTSLAPKQIEKLGQIIDENFVRADGFEFTSEANPESANMDRLTALMGIGVNRLSLGTQTFNPGLLKVIGRRHTREQTIRAFELAKKIGLSNLSLDLIFALPRQSLSDFEIDLTTAVILEPRHLSCYELMLEPGTRLYEMKQAFSEDEEEVNIQMFNLAHDFLTSAGYEHYEISNFARPGYRCRHNLRYWQNQEYIGLGPAAAGFVNGRRYKNLSDVDDYYRTLTTEAVRPIENEETLSELARAGESAMLALRTLEGIVREDFSNRTGFDPFELFADEIDRFIKLGLLEVSGDRIHLNLRGLTLSNEVLAEFLR
jgi:oxygen-independent coproporphyrinogen-3 oxidase